MRQQRTSAAAVRTTAIVAPPPAPGVVKNHVPGVGVGALVGLSVGKGVGLSVGLSVGERVGDGVGRGTHAVWPDKPLVYCCVPQLMQPVLPTEAAYVSITHGKHAVTLLLPSPA